MAGFFKIAIRNFLNGPTTDPYPFGETFTPEKYKGIIAYDPELCIGCSTCEYVCPSGAIKVTEKDDGTGVRFVFWLNTCSFCGNCGYYCPTDAVYNSNDFHTARHQSEKFIPTIDDDISYVRCKRCEQKIKAPVEALLIRAYDEITEEVRHQTSLCPDCRRQEQFERM